MKRLLMAIGLAVFTGVGAQAAVQGKEVVYRAGDAEMKGYLAYDDARKGKRPGVLVVHEWWGHNDYARKRARMLAALGYTALAVDMYGDGKQASHPDEAGKFAGEVRKNLPLEKARFDAALELLKKQASVDPRRIAAIGYCFGGGVALEMARAGEDVAGVVSFHGTLDTADPARPGAVKAKLLVLTGAEDPFVPAEQVARFEKEMNAAGVDYRVVTYPGAKHAFTNPNADVYGKQFDLPLEYNSAADRESWQAMQEFFVTIFR
jgi:dienelactone hydrolase